MDLLTVYTSSLVEEVEKAEPAGALLVLILLQLARQSLAVHASGKFVTELLLKMDIDDGLRTKFARAQALVVASLKKKSDEHTSDELVELLAVLKAEILRKP